MTITYPLAFPTDPSPRRISVRAAFTVGLTRSPFTHHTQAFAYQGMSWVVDVSYPPMKREAAEEISCFLLKLGGQAGTFMLGDPLAQTPRGIATGTPKVSGGSNQGQTLLTKGWTISQTGILKKGDYLQIGNYLYKNLNDVNSDGSGNATLDIFPVLRETYADDTAIVVTGAQGIFRLTDNIVPIYNATEERLYEVGFTAIEALEYSG